MFEQVTTEEVMRLAARAGREVARKYPGVSAEDIAAEALTCLMEKIDRVATMSPGYIYEVLRRDGLAYAATQRYQFTVDSSQYIYTPREIRALLEHCYYDPEAWDVPTGKDDWLSAELDGHSIGVSLIDIKVAMEKITSEQRHALEARFSKKDTSIERKRVSRAVDALVRYLNLKVVGAFDEEHEGPGARRAMSNGTAQWQTGANTLDGATETDALDEYHDIRSATAATTSFQDPPGTHFNWDG